MSDPYFHLDHLCERILRYTQLFLPTWILEMFETDLKADMTVLHKNLTDKNYVEWNNRVHKIYGASCHVGAQKFAQLCDEAQALDTDNVSDMHSYHKQILIEYKRLNEFFEERRRAA